MRRGGTSATTQVAIAAALVIGVLWASPLQAKHAALKSDADDSAPSSDESASAPPPGATTITGEILETHDMLPDAEGASTPVIVGLEWSHRFTVTLTGRNHIEEKWLSVRLGVGARPHGTGHRLAAQQTLTKTSGNSDTIGASSDKATWHVLGADKLQRLFAGKHFLMMMNIEIGADKSCRLEAKYIKQVGFTAVVMRNAKTGEMSNYTLPQVESASCEIR